MPMGRSSLSCETFKMVTTREGNHFLNKSLLSLLGSFVRRGQETDSLNDDDYTRT